MPSDPELPGAEGSATTDAAPGAAFALTESIPTRGPVGSAATLTGPGGAPGEIDEESAALKEVAPPSEGLPDDLSLPPAILRRYESIKLLGRGGMGAVYRARDKQLERDVALKFLFGGDEYGQSLLREARSQARIDHENACKVYEVGVEDGKRFIVMQLVNGEPLDKAKADMTLEEKVRVVRQVALALHEAHRLGIVHRDVKPSNIMVERAEDGSWKPYIMDFGIAREVGARGQTITGALAGTPAFMAPEQARGEVRSLDRRTDVYSLGATLYDVLAGRPPFSAESVWKLLQRIAADEAPPIRILNRRVPEDLEAILVKCLEKEPGRRYESARALGDDLQRFLDGDPVTARRMSRGYALLRKARKHKVLVALSGAALVGAFVLVALWVRAGRIAAEQANLSRELGEGVKEMELFLRAAHTLPLHDTEIEKDVVRARLREIEGRMGTQGQAAQGPGHYALGRGHLALQEPEEALAHLRLATAAGYASHELDYAMGLALGELMKEALEDARRIDNADRKRARIAAIDAEMKAPALAHLRAALGARIEAPAYVEGLIALYEGRNDEALTKAREAFEKMPWLYEAKKLEGDAYFAEGSRFRADAAFDYEKMTAQFSRAEEAYGRAARMARSDPNVHEAQCELYAQMMRAEDARGGAIRPSYEKAKAACEGAIAASSRNDAARLRLAIARQSFTWFVARGMRVEDPEKELKEAIAQAEEVTRRRPADSMAHYVMALALRAEAYYLTDRGLDNGPSTDRSIKAYEEAIRLDPGFVWALNELCLVYGGRARKAIFRGLDPTPFLEKSVEYCDRASAVDPSFLYAWNSKVIAYLIMAEHFVDVGRSPERPLTLARGAVRAFKEISRDSPFADYYEAYAHWITAEYELRSGKDPSASIALGIRGAEEQARRSSSSPDLEVMGKLGATKALYLLKQGEDPEPALRVPRESFQRAVDGKPWDLGFRVWRARVELIGLRAALAGRAKVTPGSFDAAFAPLLPLLDKERVDPRLYQAMAEIHELKASYLHARKEGVDEEVRKGLEMAEKALALNPHMGKALVTKGGLLLARARAAREPRGRIEAARAAVEALSAAFKENPLLEAGAAAALEEAKKLSSEGERGEPSDAAPASNGRR